MKKKILTIALVMAMTLTALSCGKDTTGGLGQLDISSSGSKTSTNTKSEVPNLNGGKSETSTSTSTEAPSPASTETTPAPTPETPTSTEPTPTPAPQTGLATVYCNDTYFTGYIPSGWTVNSQAYDDGTGNYRLAICIYDSADYNTQITFFTGLEPFWTSEKDKNTMAPYLTPIGPYCPVISELSASAVLGQWNNIYTCLSLTDITNPRISSTVPNFSVVGIAAAGTPDSSTGMVASDCLAVCTVPGAAQQYAVYFSDSLAKMSVYGIPTYYISYSNFILSARAEVYETYLPVMAECIKTFDFSLFNQYNQKKKSGITADADVSTNNDIEATAPADVQLDLSTIKFE